MKRFSSVLSIIIFLAVFIALTPQAVKILKRQNDVGGEETTYEVLDRPDVWDNILGIGTTTPQGSSLVGGEPQSPEVTPSNATTPANPDASSGDDTSSGPDDEKDFTFVVGDDSWFDDALFIGDSRTDGIRLYSGIKNADYFCNTGATMKRLVANTIKVSSPDKTLDGKEYLLGDLLDAKQYKKIYIMVGINEIGSNINTLVSQYGDVLKWIKVKQPQALIFVMANLHVTKARSDKAIYNLTNARLDSYNGAISAFADNKTVFYLDVNEIFDDGNGNLRDECTSANGDGAHLLAKYYKEWATFLLQHTVLTASAY